MSDASLPAPEDYPFWGRLEPGPFAAGFRVRWLRDHGRTYVTRDEPAGTRRSRPLLFAVWYPAAAPGPQAAPLNYGDYYDLPVRAAEAKGDPWLAGFAGRLVVHNVDMACTYGPGTFRADLDEAGQAALARYLSTPTTAYLLAPAADADAFPVVLYHPGLGSSYEDNAGLFEYLASHGYVVVSSAYPPTDPERFGIDGDYERSFADLRFLLNAAADALPFADTGRVAVMGHSYGAHAATSFRSEPASPADAVISLDSTMETCQPDHAGFQRVRDRLALVERMTAPMLLVSGRSVRVTQQDEFVGTNPPHFEPYDGCVQADRWYMDVPVLEHPEFVSQGVLWGKDRERPYLWQQQRPRTPEGILTAHADVCLTVRCFLDATFKDDGAARRAMEARAAGAMDDPTANRLTHRPVGTSGAPTEGA